MKCLSRVTQLIRNTGDISLREVILVLITRVTFGKNDPELLHLLKVKSIRETLRLPD